MRQAHRARDAVHAGVIAHAAEHQVAVQVDESGAAVSRVGGLAAASGE